MKYNGKQVTVDYSDFPDGLHRFIKAFVAEDDDGYFICIDSRRAPVVQRFALGHELAHLIFNHELMSRSEYKSSSRQQLQNREREANKAAWHYYRAYRDNQL